MLEKIQPKLVLACKHCHWIPDSDLTMGVAKAHYTTEHDTDKVDLDLVALCTCGEIMVLQKTYSTGSGFEDHMRCNNDGNYTVIRRGK